MFYLFVYKQVPIDSCVQYNIYYKLIISLFIVRITSL